MEKGGRRAAQVYVLDRLEPDKWEFVLTVDGDSVLDERALEHQLRAFSRSRVTATVGMRIVRGARQHLLSRITEVHIGTSYARRQAYAALPSTPETVPGAPAVHRAGFLFRHKHCYLAGGEATFEGEVVGVGTSIAWTRAPAEAETAFQRLRRRWRTGWCVNTPALSGPSRLKGMPRRLLTFFPLLAVPLTVGYALLAVPVLVGRGDLRWSTITLYVTLYFLVRYAASSLYFIDRPAMSSGSKLRAWLLLTPAETAFDLFFIVPMKYAALFTRGGRRREAGSDNRHAGLSAASPLAPGTVYFSGHLPDEPIMTADTAPVLVAAARTAGGTDPSDDREESHD
jgi:hyaluronan synthase